MKLKRPIVIRSAAFIISLWLRGWMCTVKIDRRMLDASVDPRTARSPHLYMFWHEGIFVPAYACATQGVPVLISSHSDGELVAQVFGFMGGRAIRGSSTRGGMRALREMLAKGRNGHLAITPDGPRGPRRVVQPGAVFLASHAGMTLVPVGIHVEDCWRLKSWDQMLFPRPFQLAHLVYGQPIHVPPGLSRDQIDAYLKICQQGMDQTQSLAEEPSRQ